MADQLQLRGGTTSEHATFTGALREVTVDTDKDTVVVHDNATVGGRPLLREDGSNSALALGSAGTPSLKFTGDTNTGIYSPGADQVGISTGGTGRLFIDSSGRVGIGSTSPNGTLDVANGDAYITKNSGGDAAGVTSQSLYIRTQSGNLARLYSTSAGSGGPNGFGGNLYFQTKADNGNLADRVTITQTGNVGIGTTAPNSVLQVNSGTNLGGLLIGFNSGSSNFYDADLQVFRTGNGTERARIDDSGRLLVGTSSTSAAARVMIAGGDGSKGTLNIASTSASPADGDDLGLISFNDSAHIYNNAIIRAQRDGGTWTATTSKPTRLVFSTTADGASSPTERMRIASDGSVRIQTSDSAPAVNNVVGVVFNSSSQQQSTVAQSSVLILNRKDNDGTLLAFRQDGTEEGTISVSGTTVSYNGAHLSRWSQLPGGAEREEILRGTVLSNIDEMCGWGEEDNEQLNRMKVSDVEGDRNVSGVFQAWDDDDDTYTDDFYCAMTGDFIIRIAEGVTVQRGDLLMSAGNGTAKPQDDDIIRSKTIAKVTSTHVTCTYEDGSYCVPCVLMAC
jgi:hypothetical protein